MSTDVTQDLVDALKAVVPQDVTSSALATDLVESIVIAMQRAEQEVSRLFRSARLSTSVAEFVDLHLKDRGLRRQGGETDSQGRARAQKPPQAITPGAIREAVEHVVGTRASLQMATPHCSTLIGAVSAGEAGDALTLALYPDGPAAGRLDQLGIDHVFHYEPGVTLVAALESAIGQSALLEVVTPDGSGVLDATDVMGKTHLSGGANRSALIELPLQGAFFDNQSAFMDDHSFFSGARGVVIVLIPQELNAKAAVSDLVRSKIAAGKIWFVLEYV